MQLVLIIEGGTHWRQVKGIKSYITLSGGGKSQGQIVYLWVSLCLFHSVDVTLLMYSILKKLDFENLAQHFVFLLSQCSGATQLKLEFLLKLMKNIGYTDLNLSIFPYI